MQTTDRTKKRNASGRARAKTDLRADELKSLEGAVLVLQLHEPGVPNVAADVHDVAAMIGRKDLLD